MKFNTATLIFSIKHQFTRMIRVILVLGIIWQGFIFGVAPAFAAGGANRNIATPLLATSSMSKQINNKIDEAKDKAESVMRDSKKSAESNMRKTKKSIKSNAQKAESSVKENTKQAKNFLGF